MDLSDKSKPKPGKPQQKAPENHQPVAAMYPPLPNLPNKPNGPWGQQLSKDLGRHIAQQLPKPDPIVRAILRADPTEDESDEIEELGQPVWECPILSLHVASICVLHSGNKDWMIELKNGRLYRLTQASFQQVEKQWLAYHEYLTKVPGRSDNRQ